MRWAWFIARNDVAHLLRHRETIMWTFVMPLVFFYFIGTITGGSRPIGGSADRPDPLALRAPADGGFLVDELARRLEQQHFAVERPATDDAFERMTRRLTVPVAASGKTFTDAVLAGEAQTLAFRSRADGPDASFDQVRVQRAVYTLVADLAVAKSRDRAPDAALFRRLEAQPRRITLKVETAGRRLEPPAGFEQTIPGTMVMFTMLVLLTSGAIVLVFEREQGLLRRLASTPLPRWAVVAGKWGGRLALGLVQVAFAMLAGTVLFKMNWGHALPMVALVMFSWAAFCASLGLLLGNLARTPAQMAGIGVLSTMILAALGGCWWPIEVTPRWMQAFALWLPTGWAMDAIHKLVSFGDAAPAAAPHVAGLLLAALVAGVAGVKTFRYQ
jgi:ABC-2 type transport system permease protein